jgi:hypothetical protein
LAEPQSAQVAALRNQGGVSSTDSSPRAEKSLDKKKEKRKKKKKGKEAASPDTPYIKPEPKSPSPFAVAPLPRPHKRQRQSGQYAAELNYDEPRYDSGADNRGRNSEKYDPRAPAAYGKPEARYEHATRRPEPLYQRAVRQEDGHRRVGSDQYSQRLQSPTVFTVPYTPSEVRAVRAPSHAVSERRFYEEPRSFRESFPQASIRRDTDRERSRSPRRSPIIMGPPRQQTVRLVIDQYGNKFYESVPAASIRQSVAPPVRYHEDVIYERAPVRAVSSRQPIEIHDDDEVVYRRPASPLGATPRRVVTQPEFAIPAHPDFRSYRQREHSVRPIAMGPPGEEYVRAPDRRQVSNFEEAPREYIPRAISVHPDAARYERAVTARPEPLPVRYEIPRDYAPRTASVRPEAQVSREYAASAVPETRREIQAQREYSVRPLDPPPRAYSVRPDAMPRREPVVIAERCGDRYYEDARRPVEVRREYIPVPRDEREYIPTPPVPRDEREYIPAPATERYYEEPLTGRPANITYSGRPRAGEVVYADEGRSDGYIR